VDQAGFLRLALSCILSRSAQKPGAGGKFYILGRSQQRPDKIELREALLSALGLQVSWVASTNHRSLNAENSAATRPKKGCPKKTGRPRVARRTLRQMQQQPPPCDKKTREIPEVFR